MILSYTVRNDLQVTLRKRRKHSNCNFYPFGSDGAHALRMSTRHVLELDGSKFSRKRRSIETIMTSEEMKHLSGTNEAKRIARSIKHLCFGRDDAPSLSVQEETKHCTGRDEASNIYASEGMEHTLMISGRDEAHSPGRD